MNFSDLCPRVGEVTESSIALLKPWQTYINLLLYAKSYDMIQFFPIMRVLVLNLGTSNGRYTFLPAWDGSNIQEQELFSRRRMKI